MAIAEGGTVTDEQRLRPPSLFLMLAETMTGETPFADVTPFAVERFG